MTEAHLLIVELDTFQGLSVSEVSVPDGTTLVTGVGLVTAGRMTP